MIMRITSNAFRYDRKIAAQIQHKQAVGPKFAEKKMNKPKTNAKKLKQQAQNSACWWNLSGCLDFMDLHSQSMY